MRAVQLGLGMMILALLIVTAGGGTNPVTAQGGGYSAFVLRPPGPQTAASSVRLAVTPEQETLVAMRLIAGVEFGTDTLAVEAWNGSAFEALPINGLLDPQTNLITPDGIALTFDRNGVLFAAVNREFPDDGAGEARTLVARFDAGGWVQTGAPVGEAPTIGPLYLFDARPGLTLASIEEGPEQDELRARALEAGVWVPLDIPVLNIDPDTDAEVLFAAEADGLPVLAWVEYSFIDGVGFAYADVWDRDSFAAMPEVPLVEDIEIDLVELTGLAGGPGGEIYLATSEEFEDVVFYEVWLATPPFDERDTEWESLLLPLEAEESPCAVGHTIAAGPRGEVYYAWAEPCEERIRVAVSEGTEDWQLLGRGVPADNVLRDRPMQMVVGPEGVVYVAWMAPTRQLNYEVGIAAFVPN